MKRLLIAIIFVTCASTFADESIALHAAQADLEKINEQIKNAEANNANETLRKLKAKKYDLEREIHHWELLSNLHSK